MAPQGAEFWSRCVNGKEGQIKLTSQTKELKKWDDASPNNLMDIYQAMT
jgi:hypothetical protein